MLFVTKLKFGTGPVRNAYLALGHTDLSSNLNNLNDFLPKWNYPKSQDAGTMDAEWGASNNIRFLLSSVGSKVAYGTELGNTLYNVPIMGMEAYANIRQDNMSSTFTFRPAIYSDPLAQICTMAWTTSFCPRILNDLWLTLVQCSLA